MAQKAKFKFLGQHQLSSGILVFDVELTDADNDVSRYIVTDYYNSSKTKIVETTIEKVTSDCDSDNVDVDEDSYLGKQICNFLEDAEHEIPA
tara:strand:- start:68 stop:343 length:276 start_codon:yes stop_codon:yes gene_type:complete